MSERTPLFSVVIPTYNRARLIGKTLDSILAQAFNDYEIIVIDDGSKDNTETIVRGFQDRRITYYKKENGERGAARNFGRKKALGTYINFFDSDDLMYPNHLAVAKNVIDLYQSPEFFHLGYDFQTPEGTVTQVVNNQDKQTPAKALFDNFLSCNGVILRKDIAEQFPFEEDRKLASAEDWELWIRLLSRFTLRYSNEVTTSVVNHDLRSLTTIPIDKIVARDLFLIELLKKDRAVMRTYGSSFRRFVAQRYTFFMLRLAGEKRKKEVISWALRAFRIDPGILFSKRFLSSVRKILT